MSRQSGGASLVALEKREWWRGNPCRSATPGQRAFSDPHPRAPARVPDRFDELKGWVLGAYGSSEAGMRELRWTGNVFLETFPGCEHPEGHS